MKTKQPDLRLIAGAGGLFLPILAIALTPALGLAGHFANVPTA